MKTALSQRITASPLHSLTILFLLAAPLVVVLYGSYIFNPAHADTISLYVIQLVADIIGIVTIMGLWLTILLDVIVPDHHRKHSSLSGLFLKNKRPTIDILITVAGEPVEVVERTLYAVLAMNYPHTTYVLDDGKSQEVKKLCESLQVHYVTRSGRAYAKAGNVNNGLKQCSGEYFAIFDADQVPREDFIERLLPYMENEKIALVQSPQHFDNTDKFIALGTSQAQEIFYKHVCPSKNISDSAFCVGTNMIFRRSAIDQIGGIAQVNHSEDIWTSYLLHSKGWSSIFVNEVLASGQAPDTIASYFKQQIRWARGGLGMLFFHNPLFSRDHTLDQRIQYFSSNIFYLVGISIVVYIFMPLLYLLFGLKPFNTQSGVEWLLHYIPYFALYYSLSALLLGKLHIATISTALASFYPYLIALFTTVFGTQHEWVATTSRMKRPDFVMKWIWPHVGILLLSTFSLVVGWYEPHNFWATFFNTVWTLWNMYLLIIFITGERRAV